MSEPLESEESRRPFSDRTLDGIRRHVIRFFVGFFLIVGLAITVVCVRFYAGEPDVAVNYAKRYNDAFAAVPESDRAWPEYRRIDSLILQKTGADFFHPVMRLRGESGWHEVRDMAKALEPELAQLRAASARPILGAPFSDRPDPLLTPERMTEPAAPPSDNPFMLDWNLDVFTVMRDHAYWLCMDAWVAMDEGDFTRAVDNFEAGRNIAAHARGDLEIIPCFWTSSRIYLRNMEVVGDLLVKHRAAIATEDLLRIAQLLTWIIDETNHGVDFSCVRVFFHDFTQRVYTDDSRGGGRLTNEGWRLIRSITEDPLVSTNMPDPLAGLIMPGRKVFLAEVDRYFDLAEAVQGMPPRLRAFGELDEESQLSGNMPGSVRLARTMIHAYSPQAQGLIMLPEEVRVNAEALRVVVAAELYRREQGRWPDSLEDLTPAFLDRVPTDPFTGLPVLYRVIEDEMFIYSTGCDLDDDGGLRVDQHLGIMPKWLRKSKDPGYIPPDGDTILWPPKERTPIGE